MAGNPLTDPNWAANTTDQVVKLVDNIRSKTTTNLVLVARGLVFGLIAIFLGLVAVILLLLLLTRGFQAFLDIWLPHARSVYVSYLVIGGIFAIIGAVLFKKRNAGSSPA